MSNLPISNQESPHIDIPFDQDEIEEPFLSRNSRHEEDFSSLPNHAIPISSSAPLPWPALRRSSISVRKISPVLDFDPDAVLSPMFSGGATDHRGASISFDPRSVEGDHRQSELERGMHASHDYKSQYSATGDIVATTNSAYLPPRAAVPVSLPELFQDRPLSNVPSSPQPSFSHPVQTNEIPKTLTQPASGKRRHDNPRTHAFFVGLINSIIGMPVMLSFTAIIFRHKFFDSFISSLVKIVFLSSALHQIVFTFSSSLNFAVGQVQDVGLIFLSAIASGIVDDCQNAGISDANTLATVLASLSIATLLIGLLIMITGALKLAFFVQFLPIEVIGGYLAFVGYFMFLSGLGLASGVSISVSPKTWMSLFDQGSYDPLIRLLPAIAMVLSLSVVQRRSTSPYALPLFLLSVPILFYIVVFMCGWSLEQVRDGGWMMAPQPEDANWRFWNVYKLYNTHGTFPPKNIYWSAIPRQAGKLLGLYFVVAFGSSLDIAAIQSDVPDVNYDSELVTVGLSNAASGLAGVGLTGSYIFSQTLFSLRMGIESRVMGAVIAIGELLVFMAPVNTLAYIPNFYFGALVLWIGIDIAKDWLYVAAKKISTLAYLMLIGTFLAVATFGLEIGIAAGVLVAALHFSVEYARIGVKAFTVVPSRSGAVRSFKQRMILEAFDGRVAAVALSGMVFFGSANAMMEKVLSVATVLLETQPHNASSLFIKMNQRSDDDDEAEERERRIKQESLRPVPSVNTLCQTYDGLSAFVRPSVDNADLQPRQSTLSDISPANATNPNSIAIAGQALQEAPLVLLLDFSRVHGIDATAARSFVTLNNRLKKKGVRLALTGLRGDDGGREMLKLLVGQGLILQRPTAPTDLSTWTINLSSPPSIDGATTVNDSSSSPWCAWFPTMDEGLSWCEEAFLHIAVKYGLCEPSPQCVTLAEVLRANLEIPRAFLGDGSSRYEATSAAAILEKYCTKQRMKRGEILFDRGDPSDVIFIVECGSILCIMDYSVSSVRGRAAAAAFCSIHGDLAVTRSARTLLYGPGGIVGDLDFTIQRPRSFVARCHTNGAVWRLNRFDFQRLAVQAPHVLLLLQTVLLRVNALSATHALEALERSNF